ncbi:MAG: glycosyltransferase family 39 protein, partial [Candidatus Nealsonbacteria bacterium]|nr:glycosyltransferase family 39 protein [Candidatus Nealsonbacteria bacterium]
MSNSITKIIATFLLIFVFVIAFFSIQNDSLTMDEQAHLPAGYSYLSQMDMRLNPEHPPLIKDLSAVPLLFIKNIEFPYDAKAWTTDVNGQWIFGNTFLFKSGNPAEQMILWARIPMILLLILAGYYIFRFTKELYGNNASILALLIFSFSPTFLAHGRLVTTDVGAALGTIMATYYFMQFLKKPKLITALKAGLTLGIAELLKFSLILLIPFFGIIAIAWIILQSLKVRENLPGIYEKPASKKDVLRNFFKVLGKYTAYGILIGTIALALIYVVYLFHVWNYPMERQKSDTSLILSSFSNKSLVNMAVQMTEMPILRPFAQYFLGLCMIFQRASGTNSGYFIGEISAAGWKAYFPTVYLIKETLSF